MKTSLIAILAFGIGLGTGWRFGYTPPKEQRITAREDPNAVLESRGMQQLAVAVMSLETLNELERGNTDHAKAFLARIVADYYHIFHKFVPPSADDTFLSRIESSSNTSSVLKHALAKKPE